MPGQIVSIGRPLVEVARGLEQNGRSLGSFAYQWRVPGPHARSIFPYGVVALTGVVNTTEMVSYQVGDGMRFTLLGVVTRFFGQNFLEGSGALKWSLSVVSAGSRTVDYLGALTVQLGSLATGPFPLPGVTEFEPGDTLSFSLIEDGTLLAGAGQDALAMIWGYEYPLSEAI